MTREEFRESKVYYELVEKVKGYSKDFTFTIHYADIPKPKANALEIVLNDCIKMGVLESVSIGLDIEGNFVEESYRRV